MRFLLTIILLLPSLHFFSQERTFTVKMSALSNYSLAREFHLAGESGPAMLYLKRAASLAPRDANIRQALFSLRQELNIPPVFYFEEPVSAFLSGAFLLLPGWLQLAVGIVLLLAGSVALFLLWAYLWKPRPGSRIYAITAGVTLGVGLLLLVLTGLRYRVLFHPAEAVVMESAPLLLRPAEIENQQDLLPPGMEVKILKKQDPFWLVHSLNGKKGWVLKEKVSQIWPTP